MDAVEFSTNFGGRLLTIETGKLAKQADGAVLCRYGETVILATVVAGNEVKEGQDFFPLMVDFQEKFYAAGRIPGGFFKREAKPPDMAVLSARLIDRPIRPLFPEDFLNETIVTITVLSHDGENEPGIMGSIAASAALCVSDIPFNGPVASCRVGLIDGELVANFHPDKKEETQLDLLVSGVRQGVVMVEGLAKEVSEQQLIDAIDFAHEQMQPIFDIQEEMRQAVGKPKRDYSKPAQDESLKSEMRSAIEGSFEKAFAVREKLSRYKALDEVKAGLKERFGIAEPVTKEEKAKNALVGNYYDELKSEYARALTINSKNRIDGRSYTDIRPISCMTGLLPRVHGSAVFTRGETQVMATVTLGTKDDEQKIDSINGPYQKTFLLHYNFPPYSVGEARPSRPPGRREIGHGTLAERALSFVVPTKDEFPYTIRVVSEVLESNGSSSMATVCSGSLALMDAGVPIKKAVAGVAMGLIKEDNEVAVLSDILGDEDHLGDMDFKVCGTSDGITAFQMDLKIGGVTREIMETALAQAKEGRLHILEKMRDSIEGPREALSTYAPRIFTMKVKPEKVREVIGAGGKVIRGIVEETGVKIDIEDDGTIHIASADGESAQKAIDMVNQIVEEAEPGKVYEGKVVRITDFGAFIEVIPGTDGLCHISELEHFRVRRVEDVVREGDIVKVKCLEVDPQGKIRLSRKALLPNEGGEGSSQGGDSRRDDSSYGNRDRGGRDDSYGNRGGRDDSYGNDRGGGYGNRDRDDRGMRSDRGGDRDRGRSDRGGPRRSDSDRGGSRGGPRGGGSRGGPRGGGSRGGPRGGGGFNRH